MKLSSFLLNNVFLFFAAAAFTAPAHAAGDKATELAKRSQNPVADLVSVPVENNINFNTGPDDKTLYVLNIKPVFPVELNDKWNLINRAIIPVISQPGASGTPENDRKNGLGDITYQAYFSPKPKPGEIIWGFGPQIQLATHTSERLGNDRWAAGPTFVVLSMKEKVVSGFLLSQVWDVTNSSDNDEDISMMTFQPFYNYNFGKGWFVMTAPIMAADWEAKGEQWTVPVGGGGGRVIKWGKQAVSLRAEAYGNVIKPDQGPDYSIQLTATFLFPKNK